MKAVVIEKPGVVTIKDRPIPKLDSGFALVKVHAAAVCATDLEVIDGNIPANYPLTPGHEWSGVVVDTADECDKGWIGKRVIGSNDVVCLKCDACRSGNWRYCNDFEEIGFKRDGAYAEYVAVPTYGLYEISDSLPFENAALCEPLGVALGTLEKANAHFGDNLLIMGAGSIGLCVLSAAKAMGLSDIVVCAKSAKRLDKAKIIGADHVIATDETDLEAEMKKIHPHGTDIIIDCTGIESCIQSALRLAKKGGTVALAGYGRGKIMNIRIDDIHIKNLSVVGAGNNWNYHKKAAKLMEQGKIDLTPFVSERLSLCDYQKAIDDARNRPVGFVKAVFEF